MELLPCRVTSPRLVLRQWVADDEPALSAAITASLDHLRPWMPWIAAEPVAPFDRRALIAQWHADREAGGDVVLGIFSLTGEVFGGTGFHRRLGPRALEIGYWVHAEHVGRGYAREAAGALTDAAFAIDGIERVEIHHDRANVASGRVPDALGFTMIGEVPRDVVAPAETGVQLVWRVTREDWLRRRCT